MNIDPTIDLLRQRDMLVASSEEFSAVVQIDSSESDEIRELGRIVLETSEDECVIFSCT